MCKANSPSAHPPITVGEIFRARYDRRGVPAGLSKEQCKAFFDLMQCRTPLLGGYQQLCQACGLERSRFNSCGNRHCPTCQSLAQARWIETRLERILPVGHFHVVFTLPDCLRDIAYRNQRIVYDLLFRAVSETLLELCQDASHLGAAPGITMVLHTWTRELGYHPHLHCTVTAGGLQLDTGQWIVAPQNERFLLPVEVVSKVFRGKMMAFLKEAEAKGQLDWGHGPKDPQAFDFLRRKAFAQDWNVYAKRPFGSDQHVFRYLGRYTHRVGISNQRVLSHANGKVTFLTKNGKHITVTDEEFVRRWLFHVLPKGFVKIRHCGLYSSAYVPNHLERARQALQALRDVSSPSAVSGSASSEQPSTEGWAEQMLRLSGIDPLLCPRCQGPLSIVAFGESRWHHARAPP